MMRKAPDLRKLITRRVLCVSSLIGETQFPLKYSGNMANDRTEMKVIWSILKEMGMV